MSILLNQLGNAFGDDVWNQCNTFGATTGFTLIDALCTSIERDSNGNYRFYNNGLFSKPYTFTGKPGVGKTTLAIQLITAAVDRFIRKYGNYVDFVFFDIEKHSTVERVKALARWDDMMAYDRMKLIQKKTTIEDLFNEVQNIAFLKDKHKDIMMCEYPMHNLDDTPYKNYYPTFVLIDSIAAIRDFIEFEQDKAGNLKKKDSIVENIDAMRTAKKNTAFITQIKNLCTEYNICLIMINHKIVEPGMGPMDKPTKNLLHLKPGEKLSGGNELMFQSAFMVEGYFGSKLNEFDPVYGDYIRGSINKITFTKNKNGKEGLLFPMVFDSEKGYMPELSDFEILLTYKYGLSGVGTYYLDVLPEFKITRKKLYEMCLENPILARAIQFTAKCLLYPMLVFDKDPYDIKSMVENLSYEDRINLILSHTEDYPGYANMGLSVDIDSLKAKAESERIIKFAERVTNIFDDLSELKMNLYKDGYVLQEKTFGLADLVKNNKSNDDYILFE